MKKPLTPYNTNAILKNLELVFKSMDINKLNKPAYNCLYQMSGFIAHYDINGFKGHYTDLRRLITDILSSEDTNDPDHYTRDPFFAKNYGEEYCISEVETYKGLRSIALKHRPTIEYYEQNKETKDELTLARNIAQKHGYELTPAPETISLTA